jgi:transcriptional regulator with XRE-family HTH domain
LGQIVAANLRGERARRRLTQEDLGLRVGWSRQVVWHIEAGARELKVAELPALCRALDVSLWELARGADPDDLAAMGL